MDIQNLVSLLVPRIFFGDAFAVIREARERKEERGKTVHVGFRFGREATRSDLFCRNEPPLCTPRERPRDIKQSGELGTSCNREAFEWRNLFLNTIYETFDSLHFAPIDSLVCSCRMRLYYEERLLHFAQDLGDVLFCPCTHFDESEKRVQLIKRAECLG